MTTLAELNAAVQAAPGANASVKAWINAATEILDPPPPSTLAGQTGIVQYGGTLASMTHLDDGTYGIVVGDWQDQAILAKVSGVGFAYSCTYFFATTESAPNQPVLDTSGTDTFPGYSLTPAEYVSTVVAALNASGCKGVFLDNCDSQIPGILAGVQTVAQGLHAAGKLLFVNAGGYISGNPGSNDGALWQSWAAQLKAAGCDRILCENWQYANGATPPVLRVEGTDWYQYWQTWQACVAVCPDEFVGLTYGPVSNAVYGRASMLTAPGCTNQSCFAYNSGDGSAPGPDPYNPAWTMTDPVPTVNSTAGTATL